MGASLSGVRGAIPWYRAAPYMTVTLKKLVQRLLATVDDGGAQSKLLYLENEVGRRKLTFPPVRQDHHHLFLMPTAGAGRVCDVLTQQAPGLQVVAGEGDLDVDMQHMFASRVIAVFGEAGAFKGEHALALMRAAMAKSGD